MPIKVSLEGNIGAGKTTFLKLIQSEMKNQIQIMDEPLELWRSMGANEGNILELFYKDPVRWSYTFQSFAFYSRIMTFNRRKDELNKDFVLFERSLYSDKNIFAQNSFNTKYLNRTEWDVYNQWFGFLVENIGYKLDGIVYLRCSPEKSLERVRKRGRQEESTVSLDYLQSLFYRHESWLLGTPNEEVKRPEILILDVEEDFEGNVERSEGLMKKFKTWLSQIENTNH